MECICPACKKDDAIQRVATVVKAGKSSGTFVGPTDAGTYSDGRWLSVSGFTTLHGSSTTELARLLESPPEPRRKSFFGFVALAIVLAITMPPSLIAVIGSAVFGITAFIGILNNTGTMTINGETTSMRESLGSIIAILCCSGGLPLVACIILPLSASRVYKWEKKERSEAEIRYSVEKGAWDSAMQKWNRLYFCFRDGIVFDPDDGHICQPSQIKEFIYT